jgi:hypothetical protein
MALLTAVTTILSLAAIRIGTADLARAIMPGLLGSTAMALIVLGLDLILPPLGLLPRLALLVGTGMAAYAGLILIFARSNAHEVMELLRRPDASPAAA